MTHQSVILLWTLAVMVGACLGYWIAWCADQMRPFVSLLLAVWSVEREASRLVDTLTAWQEWVRFDELRAGRS